MSRYGKLVGNEAKNEKNENKKSQNIRSASSAPARLNQQQAEAFLSRPRELAKGLRDAGTLLALAMELGGQKDTRKAVGCTPALAVAVNSSSSNSSM